MTSTHAPARLAPLLGLFIAAVALVGIWAAAGGYDPEPEPSFQLAASQATSTDTGKPWGRAGGYVVFASVLGVAAGAGHRLTRRPT